MMKKKRLDRKCVGVEGFFPFDEWKIVLFLEFFLRDYSIRWTKLAVKVERYKKSIKTDAQMKAL